MMKNVKNTIDTSHYRWGHEELKPRTVKAATICVEKDGLYYKYKQVRHNYTPDQYYDPTNLEVVSKEEITKDEYKDYQLGPNDNWLDRTGGGQWQ